MSATPSRVAPPSSAAAADAHGAVAVAVGLDDRDDLGVGEPAQVPHVRGDRADVDGRLAQHAGGQAAHAPPPGPPGSRPALVVAARF